jgi:DNA-binding transcriptional LysR family regulator
MRTTFDMDALRTIVTGTDLQSFARAAQQLGRSQSAISMQLKKLEEQAGKQLFRRSGRGLVPTEAGEALLTYARRIIALNDEAATSVGAPAAAASVRVGLPQDLFEDVMPGSIIQFSRRRRGIHVEVRAGRNFALEEEVESGQLDVALAFFPVGAKPAGKLIASLPMMWLGGKGSSSVEPEMPLPLVLFDHPCLFRRAALQALEAKGVARRLSLTTPSLPGIWATLRSTSGITVRTVHRLPQGIREVGSELGLPRLPKIELRMLHGDHLSPAASDFRDTLEDVIRSYIEPELKMTGHIGKTTSNARR